MKRIAVALLLAGVLLQARPAVACTCAVRSLPEHIEAASAVFTGTVRDVRADAADLVATFDVTAVYKGSPGRRAGIITAQSGAACGIPFEDGGTFVVFAAFEGDALATDICRGTTDEVTIVAGLTPLEVFAPPEDQLPGDDPEARSFPIGAAAGLLTLVLAASLWAWLVRVKPPRPLA